MAPVKNDHHLLWQEPNSYKQKRDIATNSLAVAKGTRPSAVSEDIRRGTPQSVQTKRNNVLDAVKHKVLLRATERGMTTHGGNGGKFYILLTSVLDGEEWLASRHGNLTPTERTLGVWVGPKTGLWQT
jgi:hypothetical protein